MLVEGSGCFMFKLHKVCCLVLRPMCIFISSKIVWVAIMTASPLDHLVHPVYYVFPRPCLVVAASGLDGKNPKIQVSTWLTKHVATQGDPFTISSAGATSSDHTIH